MIVLRWLGRLLVISLIAVLLFVGWLAWSNRDIPLAQIEAEYGGEDLQRVSLDGVDLAYKVTGSGPPLVLLHSHFYTMRLWEPWIDTLAQDFTVIRYDLTSHGLTGPDPSSDYSRERGIDLLARLLDHLGFDRAAIVGSSTGGALAWYFASQHPERTTQLVLINAPGMPRVTNKYMEYPLPDWSGYLLYLLPRDLFRPFLEAPVIDDSLITDDLLTEFHRMYRREGNRMAEFHRLKAWDRSDISGHLARITAPTLILWGELNPQLPVEHVQQYEQQLISASRVESHVYPGVGHVLPLELPEDSVRDTRAFLLARPTP